MVSSADVNKENKGPRPLKVCVIGAGRISQPHLAFLKKSELADLCGLCELSPSLAGYAARKYGIPVTFSDYTEMLERLSPDVVHVLTPAPTHKQIVIDCLKAKAHVIAEKPIALTKAEFDEMWKSATDNDRKLVEDHNLLFNRPVQSIDKLINNGQLGEVKEVEVRMALNMQKVPLHVAALCEQLPCGIVHDLVSHLVYLALHFLPGLKTSSAIWQSVNPDLKFDDLDALLTSGTARARIRFTTQTWPDSFTITVRGDAGSAEIELYHTHLSVKRPRSLGKQLTPICNQMSNGLSMFFGGLRNFRDKIMQRTMLEGIPVFLQQTYTALINGGEMPVSYDDIADTLDIIDAMISRGERS